jgi:type III secretion system chaperone
LSIDIVQLVKEAMQKLGCGSAVDDSIDPHSPICISLNSLSDMFVEVEDERVVLWSKLRR